MSDNTNVVVVEVHSLGFPKNGVALVHYDEQKVPWCMKEDCDQWIPVPMKYDRHFGHCKLLQGTPHQLCYPVIAMQAKYGHGRMELDAELEEEERADDDQKEDTERSS